MAHQSRFLSVNLNKSYGKSTSSPSPSTGSNYGNPRPRPPGGGGMVVLSRPRSSSVAAAPHKPTSRLSVPPPVNLPSLRKEHERLDPASMKPSSGHGGSGLGHGHSSSMSWTKPTPPVSEARDKDDGARSLSDQGGFGRSSRFGERAVILKGEDFPSLLATSNYSSKQRLKQVGESEDVWAEKVELQTSSALDMRPQMRLPTVSKSNLNETQRGISRVQNSGEQGVVNFPSPMPHVSLRRTSDWDDDERDRNRGFSGTNHYEGRALVDGESRSSLSRDSGRGDLYGKELMTTRKEDRNNASSWRVTVQTNRELSTSYLVNGDRDHVGLRHSTASRGMGKESGHDRLPYGDRREFGFGMGSRNPGVAESYNERVEVSSNWQKGKPFASGMISKAPMSSRMKGDHAQSFTQEKLISNVGKSYPENDSWGGKDTFSSDAMLDLNAKVFRKKKEVNLQTDIFDPVRESFEAELEKVQRMQEQERQRVMMEQARLLEYARRESEERERMIREEEERRRLLEEEAREAVWRAEQEKMEAARRAEEQRIAREEERRKFFMEEERRKEAARQKLLELEEKIARRQTEEAAANDRMKEMDSSRDSSFADWEKNERMVEHVTSSPLFNSSSMNRLSEPELKPHTSNAENPWFAQREKPENNWNNTNNLNIKFQDQDREYPSARQDTFYSNRSFHKKQFQGIHGPKPVTPTFKRGMPNDQTQVGQNWDRRNRDYDQVNVRSNVDTVFDGWDHGHFDGNQLVSYSDRSYQNNEVDDLTSFNRIRHTVRQPRVPPPPPLSSSMRKSPFRAASVGANSSFSTDTDAQRNQTIRIEESNVQISYDCSYHQRVLEPGTPELLEESAISLLQTEEKSSPRYGSQSSLSVSNPPSSPTQLSHDEFDDCGGSSPVTTSAEEENINFSEVNPSIPELDAVAELIPFSHGEDDEWAVEDNEEVQEEEEEEEDHDDDPDSSQEDNKALDSGAEVLEMKNKFEDLDEVEKPMEMYDTGYDIDVCGVKMNTNHGLVSDSTSELAYDINSANNSLQSKVSLSNKIMNAFPEIAETTIEAHEDQSFGQVINVDQPTVSVRESNSSGPNPSAAASCFPLSSTSSLCTLPASASISSDQYDIPAKLQFGLFSSPPLIPSPIPTIQIGSIHMPLPLSAHNDSYNQMHHSHSPLFQFGQIRYASSISQSALPIGAVNTPFVHPPIARHTLNRNPGSSLNNQLNQKDSTSAKDLDKRRPYFSADKQTVCTPEISAPCQSSLDSDQPTALLEAPRQEVLIPQKPISAAPSDERITSYTSISGLDNPDSSSNKNFRSMVHSRRTRGRPHFIDPYFSARKFFTGQQATGIISEFKGNRLTYNVRHAGSFSSPIQAEFSYANRPQRRARRPIQGTEYRVKETDGARKMQFTESSYYSVHPSKASVVDASSRKLGRKGPSTSKSTKLMNEETNLSGSQVVCTDNNMSGDKRKETIQFSMGSSGKFQGCQENLSKSGILEDDIDAPLQSGIVRVFNQPGIEASSDGDGFVEVRSKRKISNERRGQRERESNTKHRVTKVPRKHPANLSCDGISYKSEISTSFAGGSTVYKPEAVTNLAGGSTAKSAHSDLSIGHRRPSTDLGASKSPISSMEGQMIPSTGSPTLNSTDYDTKSNSLKSNQTGCNFVIVNDGVKVVPSLSFGNDIVALDKASVPLGNWSTVPLNKKANTSTKSQNDEASDPVEFSSVSSAKDSPDDIKLAISSVTKEKLSFSSEDLLNFPFDGDKIQFGAVAPPLPLPHSSLSVPSGIWPPGSVMLNASIIHNLPVSDHCQSNFFDKEKCTSESCPHFDDTEAEAEAAASAIAVAAITNDEIIVSKLGTCSISGIGNKVLSGPGMPSCTGVSGHSTSEESLVVTLPADLSVDTTLSLWPPLPNLQSSRPMLSHMAGAQPSPFPFFDPNPMLGGPIFAFRPQDESTGTPAQQQQSATFVSGPTGTWPQCHSGVDSFYGSPAGFPAPFMSPPAGLTGVHGHPQMVFYNHFAPVGQFGQVGLSYMGNGYLPTGKQPDWKHGSEGATTVNLKKTDASHLNVVYGQQSAAHMSAPVQHLSTGSAVMQVNSPFTMFNLRPFQSSSEMPVPTHWRPPIPLQSPHSVRLSTPPDQLRSFPSDASGAKVTSSEPHSAAAGLPDELGLVESNSTSAQTIQPSGTHAAPNIKKDSNGIPSSAIRLSEGTGIQSMPAPKPRDFKQTASPARQHLGPFGKAGSSLNTSYGGEWGRRNTFQARDRNHTNNKNVGSSKMKQIYVAKSLLTSPATSS